MKVLRFLSSLFVLGVLLPLFTGGCATWESMVSTPVDPPEDFSRSGSAPVPDRWWTTFGDTELNRTVGRALQDNFDLRTAWNRLREARAILRRESASLYPSLEGEAQGTVQNSENDGFTGSDENEQIQLGLSAQYEVDLWGRIESSVEAQRFRTRASRYDYQTAALSLSAEVTRTWFQLAEQYRQRALLKRQIKTNQQILELIEARFKAGQTRSPDLLRQRQLVESTREQRIQVESRIQVLEHQLAVLLGRTPQAGIPYEPETLSELPPFPRTGLPAQLLQRRPDVRSAFQQLRAADRALAAAVSNQYPRLTFTASLTSSDNDASDLFQEWARSFTANLTAPLLDGGQREAEVERTRAVARQRLFEYGQTILTAFQDVEDAIIQERKQRERIRSLRDQLKLATQTVDRLRYQYLNGSVDYIDVLTALTEQQQLRRNLLTAREVLLQRRIALYRALAGGFETGRNLQTAGTTPHRTDRS